MKSKKQLILLMVSALALIPLLMIGGNVQSTAENPAWPKVVFFVS